MMAGFPVRWSSDAFCQLVVNDLHHQLARLNGCEHVHAHGLFLDRISKCFGYFIVDVGIQKGTSDIFEGFGNIDLSNLAFAFKDFKTTFQSVA